MPPWAWMPDMELQDLMFALLSLVLLWPSPSLEFSYSFCLEWECLPCIIVCSLFLIFIGAHNYLRCDFGLGLLSNTGAVEILRSLEIG
jgi:hypothetical protein